MTTSPVTTASTRRTTMFHKIWRDHLVAQRAGEPAVVYIDLHLVHEVTSPQAFAGLRGRGLVVRRPERTLATMDHSVPTAPGPARGRIPIAEPQAAAQIAELERNCADFGVPLHALGSGRQGIVHVIGPELGLTQPGMTIVCGDSHTSTHGAFGALAFGIGTSEVEHVLATQCLLQSEPRTMLVRVDGRLGPAVTAKDIILAVIAAIGVDGGTGHVIEYAGSSIGALSMEERMTVCNMSIEAGARAGLIAPDDTTFEYLAGRERAPAGAAWDDAVDRWRRLPTDEGAVFDRVIAVDGGALEPMITYGTNPGMGIPLGAPVPAPSDLGDAGARGALVRALRYMDLQPGRPLLGHRVDLVFLGSCTNSRLSDLRQAARVMGGRKVSPGVRMLVVPGSQEVKRQAEAEGLDQVFRAAGAEWRESGCSMCIAMNGDQLQPGQYAVSTSNRNFEGRQGMGGRTFLASPLTAAAAAVSGRITDPRTLL
ncbi:MAG TPA: 3-isopropylmalate dehydratase large subunit [Kofleriaceae bacterium]|nr:3-isopropylmalate dehydratase large subunit [Kofleriaceae bacterium]